MEVGDVFNPYRKFVGSFVPNDLLKYRKLSSTAKLCYARLSQYAGENGYAFPKIKTLANELGISERQTQRVLAELEVKLFIKRIKPTGKGRLMHRPDTYEFVWHKIFESNGPDTNVISGDANLVDFRGEGDVSSKGKDSMGRDSKIHGRPQKNGDYLGNGNFKKDQQEAVFSLRNPETVQAKKSPKVRSMEKSKKAPGPTQEVLQYYSEQFIKRFKKPPMITWNKDSNLIKKILGIYKIDDIKRYILLFLHTDDDFIKKSGCTIGVFVTQINKFIVYEAPEVPRKTGHDRLVM